MDDVGGVFHDLGEGLANLRLRVSAFELNACEQQNRALGIEDQRAPASQSCGDPLVERGALLCGGLKLGEPGRGDGLDDGRDEAVLAAVVVIDGRGADPGTSTDLAHGGPGVAPLRHELDGCLENAKSTRRGFHM